MPSPLLVNIKHGLLLAVKGMWMFHAIHNRALTSRVNLVSVGDHVTTAPSSDCYLQHSCSSACSIDFPNMSITKIFCIVKLERKRQ